MTASLRSPFAITRTVRGVAPAARWPAAKAVGVKRAKETARRARRRMATGQIRIVEQAMGPEAANRFFWRSPTTHPVWFDVQRRLERLSSKEPGAVGHFVEEGCGHASDPTTVFGLARHPASAQACRDWIERHIGSSSLGERLRSERLLGGAFVGAARLLLEPADAEAATTWIANVYQLPDSALFQVADSFGVRTRDLATWPSLSEKCKRRLVVAESTTDLDMLALLLPGAESVTVVATSDTYGYADLTEWAGWTGAGDVSVEHVRSRITRFSQEYIDLHEATAARAARLCESVAASTGLVRADEKPFLEVEIADFLFFQALKIRALDVLVADSEFDHIVLALGNQEAGHEFVKLVASVDGLVEDPRLEVVSISRSARTRNVFWSQVEALAEQPSSASAPARRVDDGLVLRKLDEEARRLAFELPQFAPSDRPSVLVTTANNAAYNEGTAAYAALIARNHDVRILHMGRDAISLSEFLGAEGAHVDLSFLATSADRFAALADLILSRLDEAPTEPRSVASRAAERAWVCSGERLIGSTIAPAIARLRAVSYWFEEMARSGRAPALVVLTPNRTMSVGSVAAAARRCGVPSVVLEPHVQDANYCRYLKVTSDYYGVVSEYFRNQAIKGLAADPTRTAILGSPRLIAPDGYEPVAERRRARAEYEVEYGVTFPPDVPHLVFFCQPSDWEHVSIVWGHVLDAAASTGWRVLLKTHPEEGESRKERYREAVTERGLDDRVVLLECDAATAIALAEVTITAYSTAGIDAAIRGAPVICVTDGDLPYPVDLPAIIGAPMARSAADLTDLLDSFRSEPDAWEHRARALLKRETQFIEGPGPRLDALIAAVIEQGADAVRSADEVPASIFLDPPHPVFPV